MLVNGQVWDFGNSQWGGLSEDAVHALSQHITYEEAETLVFK
jgi:hypothetical protein